ncbi:MAG: hypothetical protein JWQ69_4707 [Pseudomonas sp.]|nr:hypothetical protein [Pseudomonas sp.]
MYSAALSAVVGALGSWLCTDEALGFVILLLLSLAWGAVLSWLAKSRKLWILGVVAYCLGVLLFSENLASLYSMATRGLYGDVLGELPEHILMVVILPLLGVVAARLVRVVIED